MKKVIIFIATILIFTSCQQKVKVINVKDFGVEANTGENTTEGINKIIEELGEETVEIVFPTGRYDLYPDSNYLKPYFEPWQSGRHTIELTACRNVLISGNVIGEDVPGKNILLI